ncbi:peptide chain release factor N(5)-glutamine methyltransferase [Deltaproteobacteria bacterium]|nr:peptide chain release factor N(5)-glutamine methyltransferase [Deltaproteobacteria bacterium]
MSTKRWIIKDLLAVTTDYLKNKKMDNPRLCAETLLAHQLNISRIKLYLSFDQPLNEKDISRYRSMIKRRLKREPTQYITGVQEFWSLEFFVGSQALIPRPESEVLVEQVLSIYGDENFAEERPVILDLGTGSGAIAVSLARELQGAIIWASDISDEALRLARLNSEKHGVESRIHFIQGDLFRPFVEKSFKFDIIISNPPYIAPEDYEILPPEVRDYEPRLALDGREGGIFFIEKIIRESSDYLKSDGWLLIEMDPSQTLKALNMIEESGYFGEKRCIMDYSQRERVVIARKK